MQLIFDSKEEFINNIPKDSNIEVSYFVYDKVFLNIHERVFLKGIFISQDENSIQIKCETGEIISIKMTAIWNINVKDKFKIITIIQNNENEVKKEFESMCIEYPKYY